MKDFIETTCKCGMRFAHPYPSLQKNPPVAPSLEELRAVNEMVLAELIYHQNRECEDFQKVRLSKLLTN